MKITKTIPAGTAFGFVNQGRVHVHGSARSQRQPQASQPAPWLRSSGRPRGGAGKEWAESAGNCHVTMDGFRGKFDQENPPYFMVKTSQNPWETL